jgi:MFS-type transporter involved in bile tolerance (Atg22 family)
MPAFLASMGVAAEETLEDSLCAEMVGEAQHGMAFGTLATVNGVGDFVSSIVVGLLWTSFGTAMAFGYSAVLFVAGAALMSWLKIPPRSHPSHF